MNAKIENKIPSIDDYEIYDAPTPNVSDFVILLKPKVMSLVIFTTLIGMMLAPGFLENNPLFTVLSLVAISIGAGASGALNMSYDKDIDIIMERTKSRPIPRGVISQTDAFVFGIIFSILSVIFLGLTANWYAAGLLAFTIWFYAHFYTVFLKRRTPQNIVIGGASGSFPPVIGWLSVSPSLELLPIVMFLIIFLWTPPHFWALAIAKKGDYEKANIPMMPNIKGIKHTVINIKVYSVLLFLASLLPFFTSSLGYVYGALATVLGLVFMYLAFKIKSDENQENKKNEMRLFLYSIFYLFSVFLVMLLDRIIIG